MHHSSGATGVNTAYPRRSAGASDHQFYSQKPIMLDYFLSARLFPWDRRALTKQRRANRLPKPDRHAINTVARATGARGGAGDGMIARMMR